MIKDYILYLKKCPGVSTPRHFKVGIAQLSTARTRLAAYQNAVGPIYEESFIKVWIGDQNQITLAEKIFKREFKHKISSSEAGLSEWISEINLSDLLDFVQSLREEYFLKFVDAPEEFLPLTMPDCEVLMEWYQENKIEQ